MSNTIHGFPQSSYVWSARAGLTLAGVEYDFVPLNPGDHKQPAHLARHPFGVVPSLTVDDAHLYETSAIIRWADAVGNGSLFPADAFAAARVEQWISVTNAYLYSAIVPGYLFKYIFAGEGGPDRAAIDAIVPTIKAYLATVEAGFEGDGPWLVGDKISAADVLVGPMLFVLSRLPEGQAILAENPNCQRLMGALVETAGFMAAAPKA